jgi:hypothetical protein
MKMRTRHGCTLLYPDGSRRGGSGYIVDTDGDGEAAAIDGQESVLEAVADFFSADPVDASRMAAPKPKKKATKKKKKS